MLRMSAPAAVLASLLLVPATASAAATYSAKVLAEPSLAAQWRLGETSGSRAYAAKGPSGSYTGGAVLGQSGVITGDANKAVAFDGSNDNVTIPDQSALDLKRFSLEAWVKPTSLPTTRTKTIISKGVYWLQITPQNQFRVGFYNGASSRNATAGTAQPGQTYHVFGSYDGTTLRLCVNGVQKAAAKTTSYPESATTALRVGAMTGSHTDGFRGVIDEPAVYNAAGSCAMAKSHYDAGIAPNASTTPPPTPTTPPPPPISTSTPPSTTPITGSSSGPAVLARPAAPAGLAAVPGDGSVTLHWSDSNDLVSGDRYQVYVNGALVADGPIGSSYTVTGLTNGTSYAFRVSAGGSTLRPAGQQYGPWGAAINATPQPPPISAPDPGSPPASNMAAIFPRSYFYSRVPSSPTVSANSASWVNSVVANGKPEALGLNDWQYPQYTASASDPVYTVTTTSYVGPQGDHTVRIPAGALPAPGGDADMAITDPSSNEYWGFYGVSSIDRTAHRITARGSGTIPLDGDGSLYGESSLHEATKLGVVTPEELDAGHIDHALMVVVTCTTGAVNGSGTTRDCASMGLPPGPPNGAHLQLQVSDAELAQFPAWKQTILRAMRDYGMYIAETGGGFLKADYAPGTALATKWQNWLGAHASDAGINASGRTLDFTGGVDWRSRLRVVSP